MDSKSMFVRDELDNEIEMEIVFTFDHENIKYVIYKNPKDEGEEVFASIYTDEGELLPITTPEQWEMVEEVIGAFSEETHE